MRKRRLTINPISLFRNRWIPSGAAAGALLLCCTPILAQEAATNAHTYFQNTVQQLHQNDFLSGSQQLRIIGLLALVSLLPFAVIMLTSFTRLSIIFHLLRQALGTNQVPSTQIIIGLSLILTSYVMHPVIEQVTADAFQPYFNTGFHDDPAVQSGKKAAEVVLMEKTWPPLRTFLLTHTREADLTLFLDMAEVQLPTVDADPSNPNAASYDLNAIPWYCVIPGFVLSELRLAFMMGFLLFLPFLVIDMIVSSILMSLGMVMLPPAMIALPFKLLLFILIDGWRLIIQQMVSGYQL
jgi:flagellar biosynthetic protein FliP